MFVNLSAPWTRDALRAKVEGGRIKEGKEDMEDKEGEEDKEDMEDKEGKEGGKLYQVGTRRLYMARVVSQHSFVEDLHSFPSGA